MHFPLKLSRVGQLTTGWERLFHILIVSVKKDLWKTRVLGYGTRNFICYGLSLIWLMPVMPGGLLVCPKVIDDAVHHENLCLGSTLLMSCCNIGVTLLVSLLSEKTMRAALCCTSSSLRMLSSVKESQITLAYSRIGRTRVL